MKKITTLDIIILFFFIIIIILLLYFQFGRSSAGSLMLYIESGSSKYYYSLDQEKIIDIKGAEGITKIMIDKGKFAFLESICKNKDCIKSGWVSIPNFPVICLPNKVSAYILNEKKENEFDGISR